MINVDSLHVSYGSKQAVNGFSHCFGLGVTAIIGPNGAGKSTLLKAIAGLTPSHSGTIGIHGYDIASRAGRRQAQQHFGYLPQQPDFPGDFTVAEMLTYSAWLDRLDPAASRDALRAAQSRFGISAFWDEPLEQLSGGMRQRAFLCQSLLRDPEVLLLDEPTAAIDSVKRGEFRTEVADLAQNRTVIMTTHVAEDVSTVADWIIVMAQGTIAFSGSPEQLTDVGLQEAHETAEHPVEAAMRILSGDTLEVAR